MFFRHDKGGSLEQGAGKRRRRTAGVSRGHGEERAEAAPEDQSAAAEPTLPETVLSWPKRVLGAALERTWGEQKEAQFAAHRTTKDYIWNTAGFASWGLVFPLLTIVVSQLVGPDLAGVFSLAFITASLLMIVGNFGMRPFQVSDIAQHYRFSSYQSSRLLCCGLMLVVALVWFWLRGYSGDLWQVCCGVTLYKLFDAWADVYEGRLQQCDKLYLGGISQTLRSVLVFMVATLTLVVSHNLVAASYAMAVAAALSFAGVTLPLALLETPKSAPGQTGGPQHGGTLALLRACFPLFAALFLYTLVDNLPKFVIDGVGGPAAYTNQLFFNALYFPAQAILLTGGFIYKPMLGRMAADWAQRSRHGRFDLRIILLVAAIVAITVIGILVMGWIGIPVFSWLYGVDFGGVPGMSTMTLIMVAAGGVTGICDLLYQVIAVLREQRKVTKLYLVTFAFSLLVLLLLVPMTGLAGAVTGYLIVMAILMLLLVWQYLTIRIEQYRATRQEGLS
ncbi:MAG: lipopolysaccharide biosynthesis protein [Coriobacteriales bacterium]|jgi:O-antigen/teichoic acid export membrane protein|nr:lipopolysaccharide biosynthesis protein [Coriobacteriales bacterium]